LDAVERGTHATFNVVSPPGRFTIGGLVTQSVAVARQLAKPASAPHPVWVPADFLEAQKVEPWSDMPVSLPETGDSAGFAHTRTGRAEKAGLQIRPLHETVRDTLEWHLARPAAEQSKLKAGIPPKREREVLVTWRHTQRWNARPAQGLSECQADHSDHDQNRSHQALGARGPRTLTTQAGAA
jgi:2'-hydroxyisoflavone reductase